MISQKLQAGSHSGMLNAFFKNILVTFGFMTFGYTLFTDAWIVRTAVTFD
jgi:hypothetical protein